MRKVTIAERVGGQATFELRKSFGIDDVQGYFLERPNPDYRRTESARMSPVTGELRVG